jgi:hypothetical protein
MSVSTAIVERADAMLAPRVTRINGDWDAYWSKSRQNSSPANQNRTSLSRKSAA